MFFSVCAVLWIVVACYCFLGYSQYFISKFTTQLIFALSAEITSIFALIETIKERKSKGAIKMNEEEKIQEGTEIAVFFRRKQR